MIRTATAGCSRRSQHAWRVASTPRRRPSRRRAISRARFSVPRPPTASTRPGSAKGRTRTGQTGTPRTWWRSSRVRNCRSDELRRDRHRHRPSRTICDLSARGCRHEGRGRRAERHRRNLRQAFKRGQGGEPILSVYRDTAMCFSHSCDVPRYRPPSFGGFPRSSGGSSPWPQLNSDASGSALGSSGYRMLSSFTPEVLVPEALLAIVYRLRGLLLNGVCSLAG